MGDPWSTPAEPIRLDHDQETQAWTLTVMDGKGGSQSVVLPSSIVDALAQRVVTQRAVAAAIRSGVQAQVTVVEYANLGDSAAFIRKPLAFDPDETVGHLLDRAHGLGQPYRYHQAGERVELQVIQETIPEVQTPTGADPWASPV